MVVSARWNPDLFNKVRGLPWDHQSHVDQGELPAEKQLRPLPEGERLKEPIANDSEVISRDFKIYIQLRSEFVASQCHPEQGFCQASTPRAYACLDFVEGCLGISEAARA